MTAFIGSVWWLVVSIGILVTFHEFGHFCIARLFGVHVLRFSVGFGKPLLKRVGADGTEYVVSAIPLGGYVKMLDEREFEVDPADLHRAHNRKPVWQRMAIAAAGPAFNFLLSFVLLWTMFVIGQPDYQPIVGKVQGLAAQAGFVAGDRLQGINGQPVETWTDAAMLLGSAAMDRRPVQVDVTREDGGHALRTLPLQQLTGSLDEGQALGQIGLVPEQFAPPAVIGSITADGPVDRLHPGDRILTVNGVAVADFDHLAAQVHAQARTGQLLQLTIERAGQHLQVDVMPKLRDPGNGKPALVIGIGPELKTALRHYGPVAALGASASEMWRQTAATADMIRRIFTQGATQDLSGPVGIAQAASASAQLGPAWFLFFLAILSLSLGLINLLPVPILDGGHLLYYLIELVKGRPLSERSLAVGQYVGLVLLGGLMCVAFYNDLLRHAS
ncbi:MAG TPA: RIP metalloprotease RseP [Xanthomonadaceae bacterium]|nr:RIP metalloprotease RseP [Xanthomonadaceae bacterium]